MKILMIALVFGLMISSCGVPSELAEADMSISEIIEVPDISQDDIYIRANAWFVETFINAESVIQFQDKDEGAIMGKYVHISGTSLGKATITQTVIVNVDDGKAKLIIKNPIVETTVYAGYNQMKRGYWLKGQAANIRREWDKMIADFRKRIQLDWSS